MRRCSRPRCAAARAARGPAPSSRRPAANSVSRGPSACATPTGTRCRSSSAEPSRGRRDDDGMMVVMRPLHLRHNVVALGADYALFMVALAFASPSTILPAFAAWLGAPNVVIGAIPAVMTMGWFLPCLFAAPYTAGLARKLPFVIRWTLLERLPFPALALVAFLLAERAPALALTLTLLMLLM